MELKDYNPHQGQLFFHEAMEYYRYVALVTGIRGGKTYSGAREALRQAWNAEKKGVFLIVAPTYNMLDRTTWQEFKEACGPLIKKENDSKKIITLLNGRKIHGHSADRPDRIRNETAVGCWVDEARECKDFGTLWNVLMGRVLSTNGKIFVTTTPNSYDDIHDIFVEKATKDHYLLKFPTYKNTFLDKSAIEALESNYDEKYAKQELYGEFVVFEGAVYYTFSRDDNAGTLAYEVAQYDDNKPIELCCDFNVDPMAWVLCQIDNSTGLKKVNVIDEIYLKNSNTVQACQEFKNRYPSHIMGVNLYGDATGNSRSANSNLSNYQIIEHELNGYGINNYVRSRNPAERDRINAVNGMICNSKGIRRVQINPKCKNLIRDFEQVSFKNGSTQIDKSKDFRLTHPSDAFGYFIESEFSLNRAIIKGLRV